MAALGRKADPAEVGQLIAFLLSRESSFITGGVYTIDGGWLC
jgi:NAD(P)-dependent dehydrogenase (short-subunit alcohol dehydrogenase family)